MEKLLILSQDRVYQYNTVTNPAPTNGDAIYTRQIVILEARLGVTAEDILKEYLTLLRQRHTGVWSVMPTFQVGMNTIVAETEGFVVQYAVDAFERSLLDKANRGVLTLPSICDKDLLILDVEALKKAIYFEFVRPRDEKIITETIDAVHRIVRLKGNKHNGI